MSRRHDSQGRRLLGAEQRTARGRSCRHAHGLGQQARVSGYEGPVKSTKGQGPGLVNVLLAATHSNSFTTSALPRRERVCSGGCKRTSTSPGSWPLIARGRERVAGLAAKRTFTSPAPWPLSTQSPMAMLVKAGHPHVPTVSPLSPGGVV